jgi:hypothetical protein
MNVVFFPFFGRVASADVVLFTPGPGRQRSRFGISLFPSRSAALCTLAFSVLSFALLPGALQAQTAGGITCSSSTAKGSMQLPCIIYANTPLTSDLTINLASSSSAVTVPPTVFMPAGSTTGSFMAHVSWSRPSTQAVTLTAAAQGRSGSFGLTLLPSAPSQAPAGAALTLSSTSVAFGNVTLNTPSTQSITLTSSGTAPLTITGGSLSGTAFTVSGVSAPITLNPGQSVTAEIQFDPTTAGSETGTVTIISNANGGSTATVALSGTGQTTAYEVQLNWNAPSTASDAVAGYEVYREVSGGSYAALNSSADPSLSYIDGSVQSGSTYNYYVVSVDSSGNQSPPSNAFTVTVP